MARYTKAQLAEIEADSAYWQEFSKTIGWRLTGFTGRSHAGFDTGRKHVYLPGFNITGNERDVIMAAIAKAAKK